MRLPQIIPCSTPLFGSAALLAGVCLLALPGCGDGRPKTIQVTGTVTYRGKPVQGAHVTFTPQGNRSASGETDAEGRFTLLSFAPGDGAVAGEHVVKHLSQ